MILYSIFRHNKSSTLESFIKFWYKYINKLYTISSTEVVPEFSEGYPVNITVQRENSAFLDCPVKNPGDRPVSYPLVMEMLFRLMFLYQLWLLDLMGKNKRLAYSDQRAGQVHNGWQIQCSLQRRIIQLGPPGILKDADNLKEKKYKMNSDKVCPRQRWWHLWMSGVNIHRNYLKTCPSQCGLSRGVYQGWRGISRRWRVTNISDMCLGLHAHSPTVHILVSQWQNGQLPCGERGESDHLHNKSNEHREQTYI